MVGRCTSEKGQREQGLCFCGVRRARRGCAGEGGRRSRRFGRAAVTSAPERLYPGESPQGAPPRTKDPTAERSEQKGGDSPYPSFTFMNKRGYPTFPPLPYWFPKHGGACRNACDPEGGAAKFGLHRPPARKKEEPAGGEQGMEAGDGHRGKASDPASAVAKPRPYAGKAGRGFKRAA